MSVMNDAVAVQSLTPLKLLVSLPRSESEHN